MPFFLIFDVSVRDTSLIHELLYWKCTGCRTSLLLTTPFTGFSWDTPGIIIEISQIMHINILWMFVGILAIRPIARVSPVGVFTKLHSPGTMETHLYLMPRVSLSWSLVTGNNPSSGLCRNSQTELLPWLSVFTIDRINIVYAVDAAVQSASHAFWLSLQAQKSWMWCLCPQNSSHCLCAACSAVPWPPPESVPWFH